MEAKDLGSVAVAALMGSRANASSGPSIKEEGGADTNGGGADEEGLSAYELMRLARIRENNAALAALGFVPLAALSAHSRLQALPRLLESSSRGAAGRGKGGAAR